MNIEEKKLDNSMIELSIDVPVEKVELEYKSVFDDIQKKAKIDGFRKGKAPLNVVEIQYKDVADKEVAENLVKHYLYEAVTEKQLTPIVAPSYNYDTISRNEPFSFKANLELQPTVEPGEYKGLTVEERACEITDEDLENEIESIREQGAEFKDKGDGAVVEMKDYIKIKVKRVDGENEEQVEDDFKEYDIIVGKSKDESALDRQIVGMKQGDEQEIKVKYPEDYHINDLAGKDAAYLVRVEKVQEVILPELNDEFAQSRGFSGVEDMRSTTKERLHKIVDEKTKGEAKGKLLKQVIENGTYDVPPSMIRGEMDDIFKKYQQRIGHSADNIEEFAKDLGIDYEKFIERLAGEALSSIKVTLTLMEVIKKEEIEVSEEKYNEALDRLSERIGLNDRNLTEQFVNENQYREKIENDILFDEALDFIYNNSEVKKQKPVSFEELMRTE